MNKDEFKKMLAEVLRDYYSKYKTVGADYGFRCFYQYILDESDKFESTNTN